MSRIVLRVPAGRPELRYYLALSHSPAAALGSDTDQDSFSGAHSPTIGTRGWPTPTPVT